MIQEHAQHNQKCVDGKYQVIDQVQVIMENIDDNQWVLDESMPQCRIT